MIVCEFEGCEEEAFVALRAADKEDPSGGVLCLVHALEFMSVPLSEPLPQRTRYKRRQRLAVHMQVRVGFKDYSHVEYGMFLSNISRDHTDEMIDEMVEKSQIVTSKMRDRLNLLAKKARDERGW